jgi:hypothetical protein
VKRAQKQYRKSPEGQEQHRDEERRRRERQREGVGDRRCGAEEGGIERLATAAACQADEEPENEGEELEWKLVAWPEVLARAWQLLGSQLECGCCGRRGRVMEVLALDEWRRQRAETS